MTLQFLPFKLKTEVVPLFKKATSNQAFLPFLNTLYSDICPHTQVTLTSYLSRFPTASDLALGKQKGDIMKGMELSNVLDRQYDLNTIHLSN